MRLSFEFSNILGAVYHRGSIKFDPNGSSVFSPVGNKILVFDLKLNRSSALPVQLNYNIERICIHPRNTILLASSETSYLYMISLTSGKLLHLKKYHNFSKISHISFSPDGRYYCVAGGNIVLIYVTPGSLIAGKGREVFPFRLLKKYQVNHDDITDVSWTADSNFICVSSQDTTLNILSLSDQDRSIIRLRGHTDMILNCYFANRSNQDRQLYSLTKNCQLYIWDEKENDDEEDKPVKRNKNDLKYYRSSKHYIRLSPEPEESKKAKISRSAAFITASDYNSNARLLVVGYNTGHYSLFEMPGATMIYDLDSNSGAISSINLNASGDWIALGSSVEAQVDIDAAKNQTQSKLMVWEWQSKSHILDQVGSGASMANMHECVCYSLDGSHVVSGNMSGQIKVWSTLSGETIASFGDEHKGPIKSIKFAPNKSGKVIVSASLDGSIRAYDLTRFKNFRTFHSPVAEKMPEFICLDIDSTGEFIAAGTYNYFEIYLYSLQTGKFLEYLTGHEGPVSGVAFSPITNILISSSWDCTVRVWNLFEGSKCLRETITLPHEVITLAFRPDGNLFAASLSSGQISFFNPHSYEQFGAPIEGLDDLGTTQLISDSSRDSKKFFMSLNYSADGSYIIAGGKSNFICIYHVNEKMLMKKIPITFNMSMDGVFDYISNRKRREFGFNLELLSVREDERALKPIQLPGVRKGDLGETKAKPVIGISQVTFSPTMRSFAAATTEGILFYSLDVVRHFDPYKLDIDVDPNSIHHSLKARRYGLAIVQTLQLNDKKLFKRVIEDIPLTEVDAIISSLGLDYVKRLLHNVSHAIQDSRHLEYYLIWVKSILYKHGIPLKNQPHCEVSPIIRSLHQNCHRVWTDIKRNCDYCRYSLEYLTKPVSESKSDEICKQN